MADVNDAAPAERRKHPRFAASRASSGFLTTTDGSVAIIERIVDISNGGVRLVVSHGLAHGTGATLDVYNVARDYPCRLDLRIAYSRPLPNEGFVLGCAFERELGNLEVWGLR
jgi:hypothetical protein